MNWTEAAEKAAAVAAEWTREGGPGGAILLFDADSIRAEACGGLASIEHSLPFHADTAVRYASITKHFLAGLLLTEGRIGLDQPLGAHLPGLPPALAAVPVGRALDMTGGIPDTMETAWLLGVPWTAGLDRGALLEFSRRLDALNFAPGSEISYSNTGYRLLQAALENGGPPLGEALRERFFRPLGLTMSLPEDQTDPVPALATGYWRGRHGWQRGVYGMHFSGSGGLAGSARDLVAWVQALLADRPPAKGLLPLLGKVRRLKDGRATGYGLGLARTWLDDVLLVGHGGSLPGFKNHFLLDAANGTGVVVLTNREDADPLNLALGVMAALHGAALPPPAPHALPDGLFVATDDAFWLEHAAGVASFLGAGEKLFAAPDGVVSRAAHLPMQLHRAGDGIAGEIGHVPRKFQPITPDITLDPGLAGEWVLPTQNARLAIANGVLVTGAGPLRTALNLQPLARGLALSDAWHGPWRQRALLALEGDTLRLISNRSRALSFRRV